MEKLFDLLDENKDPFAVLLELEKDLKHPVTKPDGSIYLPTPESADK